MRLPRFGLGGHVDRSLATIDFDQVQRLQILAKRIEKQDMEFTAFELNLVLRDGRRYNIVDHHDGDLIAADATRLATVLGVPVEDYRAHIHA